MSDTAFDATTRYYSVVVANSGRVSLHWSAPFATAALATAHGRAKLDAGEATLAFVVEAKGTARKVLLKRTSPASAAKIIGHYLDLLAALESPSK